MCRPCKGPGGRKLIEVDLIDCSWRSWTCLHTYLDPLTIWIYFYLPWTELASWLLASRNTTCAGNGRGGTGTNEEPALHAWMLFAMGCSYDEPTVVSYVWHGWVQPGLGMEWAVKIRKSNGPNDDMISWYRPLGLQVWSGKGDLLAWFNAGCHVRSSTSVR